MLSYIGPSLNDIITRFAFTSQEFPKGPVSSRAAAIFAVSCRMPIRQLFAASVLALFLSALAACGSSVEKATESGARAQQLLDAQDYDGARKEIAKAISERDDIPELYILKGRIEFATGSASNAFQAYSRALSLESTNPEALQAVSQLGLQTGNLRDAEKAADTILTFNPTQPGALLVKGLVAFTRRKYDDAIDYADKVLAAQPDNEGGLILKARALALSDDTGRALEILQQAAKDGGNTQGIDLTLLELYRNKQDLQGMLATFKRITGTQPATGALQSDGVKTDYANTLYKSGNAEAARQLLRIVIRQDPPNQKLLADVTALWKEYDSSPLNQADVTYLAQDGTVAARIAVARYLLGNGEPETARRILQTISSGYWQDARALYARILYTLGQKDSATQIASAILQKDKTSTDALLVRSLSYLDKKDFIRAINDAQIVIRDNPQFPDGYLTLAQIYIAEGDTAGARLTLNQAAEKLPQNPGIFEAYSNFLLQNGETQRALAATRGFARSTPASISAWQLYAATCRRAGSGSCEREASAGEKAARTMYAIDLPPGTPPTRGLFGRLE